MKYLWLFLLLITIGVIPIGCSQSSATHKQLTWDANKESDMKEYRIYACPALPCLASGTPFATVTHTGTPTTYSVVIPDTDSYYVAYAVDTALNISVPSDPVFANVQAPAKVLNLKVG